MKNILNNINKIHFVGIGGSGMCPMAQILHSKGYKISGSDNYESETLKKLERTDIKIFIGHKKENIDDTELVVYSAAIKTSNPELIAAKEKNIPVLERSKLLGILTDEYKNLIAVSGTHGKTTTTSMITKVLVEGQKDPTAIIGGYLPFIKGNSKIGNSQTIVCEACEYIDTFLELNPNIAVISNVDADHLDYFKNIENVIISFNKFAKKVKTAIFVNGDNSNAMESVQGAKAQIFTFGFNKENDYIAKIKSEEKGAFAEFEVIKNEKLLITLKLKVPGKHNIYNALSAIAVADFSGINPDTIKHSLETFSGAHRRFEVLGTPKGITIIDDFAHHPTEIKATLNAAKNMGFSRVIAVFQPHTYSRTSMFLQEFAKALSIADIAIVCEILAVRETNTYNISSQDLVEKIPNAVFKKKFEDVNDYIKHNAKPGDLILTMGGGNIYECANLILENLSAKE